LISPAAKVSEKSNLTANLTAVEVTTLLKLLKVTVQVDEIVLELTATPSTYRVANTLFAIKPEPVTLYVALEILTLLP
jgi:hypothetical protein